MVNVCTVTFVTIINRRKERAIIYCNNYNNNIHTVHNNKTKKRS